MFLKSFQLGLVATFIFICCAQSPLPFAASIRGEINWGRFFVQENTVIGILSSLAFASCVVQRYRTRVYNKEVW